MKMDLPVEHEKPSPKRSIDSMNYDEAYRDLICNEADGEKEEKDLCKKQKKKNVIILTPPIHPINSPKIPDLGLNLEWLWIDYLFIIEVLSTLLEIVGIKLSNFLIRRRIPKNNFQN